MLIEIEASKILIKWKAVGNLLYVFVYTIFDSVSLTLTSTK